MNSYIININGRLELPIVNEISESARGIVLTSNIILNVMYGIGIIAILTLIVLAVKYMRGNVEESTIQKGDDTICFVDCIGTHNSHYFYKYH